jgi:hypothetical protein
MSVFSWLFGLVWKNGEGRPTPGAFAAAAILAQTINICVNVTSQLAAPVTPVILGDPGTQYSIANRFARTQREPIPS